MIERMPRWLAGLLLGGLVVLTVLANPTQAQSLRRAYKGNLECEQTPATSLAIIVSAVGISADTPTYDIDGLPISPAIARGSVDPAGVLHFGYTISSPKGELRANYTVTLSAVGGTLTGAQVSGGLGEHDVEHNWTCSCCGRSFKSLPTDYAFAAPDNWFALSETERATTRSKLDENLCVIDRKEYYVRGCLELPVSDSPELFVWGVWVSVSEESFRYVLDHWTSPIGPDEPPRFGWLCNWIRGYPKPREIKCEVYLRSNNQRPLIVLEPTEYPLAVEQHRGITLERVKQIVATRGHS